MYALLKHTRIDKIYCLNFHCTTKQTCGDFIPAHSCCQVPVREKVEGVSAFWRVFRTNLLPGACDADAVLHGDLGCRVGTRARVLSEAEVIVRAQVNHVLHHPTCESGSEGDDNQAQETINERRRMFIGTAN